MALHRLPAGVLAEGQANVAFTLEDIPVGLPADELRESVRPYLQQAAPHISEQMLGEHERNSAPVDLFYRRGADGVGYVFFVGPDDPRPVDGYGYASPGFYRDPELSDKVSERDLPGSGDSTHEKLRPGQGETTVYVEDDDGDRYRLRLSLDRPDELTVHVARRRR